MGRARSAKFDPCHILSRGADQVDGLAVDPDAGGRSVAHCQAHRNRQRQFNGFAGAEDYYRRSSTAARLRDEIRGGAWGELRTVVARYMRGIVNNAGYMVNLLAFLLDETRYHALLSAWFDRIKV